MFRESLENLMSRIWAISSDRREEESRGRYISARLAVSWQEINSVVLCFEMTITFILQFINLDDDFFR